MPYISQMTLSSWVAVNQKFTIKERVFGAVISNLTVAREQIAIFTRDQLFYYSKLQQVEAFGRARLKKLSIQPIFSKILGYNPCFQQTWTQNTQGVVCDGKCELPLSIKLCFARPPKSMLNSPTISKQEHRNRVSNSLKKCLNE